MRHAVMCANRFPLVIGLRLTVAVLAFAPVCPAVAGAQTGTERILSLRRAIVAHSFATLDATFRSLEGAARRDATKEAAYLNAFDVFATRDATLQSHLDAWIATEPQEPTARVARARYFARMASAEGDQEPPAPTEADYYRIERRRWLALADLDLRAARRLDRASVTPYVLMLGITLLDGDVQRGAAAFDTIIHRWPEAVLLRLQYMEQLSPRYYGSDSAQARFAKDALSGAARTRGVRVLLGFADYERGLALAAGGEPAAAIAMYSRALRFGEYWRYHESRALAHLDLKHFDEAITDLTRAIAARPGNARLFAERAMAYGQLSESVPRAERAAHTARAIADLRLAATLDPTDAQVLITTGGQVDSLLSSTPSTAAHLRPPHNPTR